MHTIILRSIQIRNLLSYGANLTEIRLDDLGITWIKGINGAGKSTILEGITVALFGTSYRGVNNTDLMNTSNQGKLYVRLAFDRVDSHGTVPYAAIREMTKAGSMKFTLEKDNVIVSKEAGVSQKMFEEEILGFNQILYENVISLNAMETKAFIDMKSEEKKKLIESILTLHIDKVKKLNSSEMTLALTKFNDAANDVRKYTQRIAELNDVKAKLLLEQADDINQLESDIRTNEGVIVQYNAQIAEFSDNEAVIVKKGTDLKASLSQYSDIEPKLNAISSLRRSMGEIDSLIADITRQRDHITVSSNKLTVVNTELNAIQESIYAYSNRNVITELDKLKSKKSELSTAIRMNGSSFEHSKIELDAVKSGIPCPTCGKESTEADIKGMKESLTKRVTDLSNTIDRHKKELADIESSIVEIQPLVDDYNALMAKYNAKSTELSMLKSQHTKDEGILVSLNSRHQSCNGLIASSLQLLGIDSGVDIMGDVIDVSGEVVKVEKELIVRKTVVTDIQTRLVELRGELTNIKNQVQSLSNNKLSVSNSISQLSARLEKRKTASEGTSIALNETQVISATGDLDTANNRILKYSDKIEVLKYIDVMYGDEGIKKLVLSVFVPNLNSVIAHNINLFNLPFVIEFDDSLNYKFIGKFGMAQVYKGLSQGQRRKLNFAISMAFRDFVALIADFRIETMFLDEVLDISTDINALKEMIELVHQKNTEIPSIMLMSHRGEDFLDDWKHILEVSHDGMYSFVEKTK